MQSVSLIKNLYKLVAGIRIWVACCTKVVCCAFVENGSSLLCSPQALDPIDTPFYVPGPDQLLPHEKHGVSVMLSFFD